MLHGIDGYSPAKPTNCAVRDYKNWSCRGGEAGKPSEHKTKMVDGAHHATYGFGIPDTTLVYQVPKWKWWLLTVKSHI